jgi:hypothetical protein
MSAAQYLLAQPDALPHEKANPLTYIYYPPFAIRRSLVFEASAIYVESLRMIYEACVN